MAKNHKRTSNNIIQLRRRESSNVNPLQSLIQMNSNVFINTTQQTIAHHDVFIDEEIEEPSRYRDLITILFNAQEEETVQLFINSPGGSLDAAMAIIEGIKNTNAHVMCFLIGACHSAASLIALHCHEIAVFDAAHMMVHTASGGSYGSVGNAATQATFMSTMVDKVLDETYTGFLSKDEIDRIKTGAEIWLTAPDIKERLGKRVAHLNKKIKAQAKKIKEASDEG